MGNIGFTSEGIQYMPDMTTFWKTALVVYWGFHRWCVHSTGEQEPKGSVVFCCDGNMFPCQQVRPTGEWEECRRKMSKEMHALWKDGIQVEQKEWEGKKGQGLGKDLGPKYLRGQARAQACMHVRALNDKRTHTHIHMCTFMTAHFT